MDTTHSLSIDLDAIARQFQLSTPQVQAAVELLDEGNTVPFITRYRKDRTGGLDEEKIRLIQDAVTRRRQLNERKERVLRSIQSQEKLTADLEQRIHAATSLKILDDLYLPYRPKKQTLATVARQRGLEPLTMDVLQGQVPADPQALAGRCAALLDPEKQLNSESDVLAGIRHILAELLSERVDLRSLVRKCLWNGVLVSKRIERIEGQEHDEEHDDEEHDEHDRDDEHDGEERDYRDADQGHGVDDQGERDLAEDSLSDDRISADVGEAETATIPEESEGDQERAGETQAERGPETPAARSIAPDPSDADQVASPTEGPAEIVAPEAVGESGVSPEAALTETAAKPEGSRAKSLTPAEIKASAEAAIAARRAAVEERRRQRRESRHRKRHKLEQSFKDYFDYSEPLKKLPHYRVLAINRGERCKVLRVRIQFDPAQLKTDAEALVVAPDHPQADLLREALHESLTRLVVPGIEREIRRELTDRAEGHAVRVFAQNLRKLLLQAPLRGHRVLAADPGFRSGCKLVALDEFGNALSHALIHVIGAEERVQQSRSRLAELIKANGITVVAIGNGTACRETEHLVASVLSDELADQDVHYVVVNEAGASVYSTSQIGREELPRYDATVRGAVSIGRRALDPLSELVKIDPASIGVGLYQHDVKAKHLRTSLDAVVESCVNYVGVDLNSASPALLGYVSGLNQLTARRVYEYRQQHGPFRRREQLKEVPGVGEATYVQAAGFLKIVDGENPLDATWIHPESYEIAQRVLAEIDCDLSQLRELLKTRRPVPGPETAATRPLQVNRSRDSEPVGASDDQSDVQTAMAPEERESAVNESGVDESGEIESGEIETGDAARPESVTMLGSAVDDSAATSEGASDVSSSTEVSEPHEPPTPGAEVGADAASVTDGVDTLPPSPASAALAPSALAERLAKVDVKGLAEQLEVGVLSLRDILAALARPGRDPREDLLPPVFRREILKLEDLKPGMELSGTVLNVVDFGAFVDIGLSDSGLIHVSRLADRFVSDPHEVVSVGDILNVWVVDVDEKRRRVSLTAIEPGRETHKPAPPNRGGEGERRGGQGRRKPRHDRDQQGAAGAQARRGGKSRRPQGAWQPRPKPKPKPVVPITDAMADGREPMRTFSDLQQFFKKKRENDRPEPDTPGEGA